MRSPIDRAKLLQEIARLVASQAELPEDVAREVAFHLTDWLDDLERLRTYFGNPSEVRDEAAYELLAGFLIHVPNHLAAASKLMLDTPVTDVFGVGATSEDEESDA